MSVTLELKEIRSHSDLVTAFSELAEITRNLDPNGPHFTSDLEDCETAYRQLSLLRYTFDDQVEIRGSLGSSGPVAATGNTGELLSTGDSGRDWAQRVAKRIWNPETRALTVGSIDVPQILPKQPIPYPQNPNRVTQLLVNRQPISGNEFTYYEQTTRTTNAAAVADAGTKPTSIYTVTPRPSRLRVIAHVSEWVPNRIFSDHNAVVNWLQTEMYEGVIQKLEDYAITGSGTGEIQTGIMTHSGRTVVGFNTDMMTSLRKGKTALQLLQEYSHNAWLIHPTDLESAELTRVGASGALIFGDANDLIWGNLPKIVTTSVTQGFAVLGDFRLATLYHNGDVTFKTEERFDTNETRMRAEIRAFVAYLRPRAFASIDIVTP